MKKLAIALTSVLAIGSKTQAQNFPGGVVNITQTSSSTTSLNFTNQNGFWHFSGSRSLESDNNFTIFYNNNTSFLPTLTMTDIGRIGIGVTNPRTKFHISSTGSNTNGGNSSGYNGDGMVIQANTGGRNTTTGAQLEFVIPANSAGNPDNPWGQARIITVAGNLNNSDATGKMILGTHRSFNKLQTGNEWYYGDDIVIDGAGKVGIGTQNPTAALDVTQPTAYGSLGTVMARLSEGTTTSTGTFLGVRGYSTQVGNGVTDIKNVRSFAIEHSFYGNVNGAINFYRGGYTYDGSIGFSTNSNEIMRLTSS